MASTRLEILKGMVEQNPTDGFARYGLAMEYRNAGDLAAAVSEFRALIAGHPDYSAAYFHGGQTLERLGQPAEARELYLRGSKRPRARATCIRATRFRRLWISWVRRSAPCS